MNRRRVEVRESFDGTIDEVLMYDADGECIFHLEQMDTGHWWFALYPDPVEQASFDLHSKKRIRISRQ